MRKGKLKEIPIHYGFQTLDNNRIHSTVHRAIFFALANLKNTQVKTAKPFLAVQILESNKNHLVNSLVMVKQSQSVCKITLEVTIASKVRLCNLW